MDGCGPELVLVATVNTKIQLWFTNYKNST